MNISRDISWTVPWTSRFYPDSLMPAMHPRDWVWVYGKGEVLMDTQLHPPYSTRIRIF
jgi:hypothetical protein